MAKSSSLELDLFNKGNDSTAPPPPPSAPIFQRRRSFRDIQGVLAKMNPDVVKSVIQNGGVVPNRSPPPTNFTHLPVPNPKLRSPPLTIFYNGMVSVFEVSPCKAQEILKVAQEKLPESAQNSELSRCIERNLLSSLSGDLPISRRNSLQRFLEKRKERLITVSPYNYPRQ